MLIEKNNVFASDLRRLHIEKAKLPDEVKSGSVSYVEINGFRNGKMFGSSSIFLNHSETTVVRDELNRILGIEAEGNCEGEITLRLTRDEAEVLKRLTGIITGDSNTTYRKYTDVVWGKLDSLGVESNFNAYPDGIGLGLADLPKPVPVFEFGDMVRVKDGDINAVVIVPNYHDVVKIAYDDGSMILKKATDLVKVDKEDEGKSL